jgi:hypothetical protein
MLVSLAWLAMLAIGSAAADPENPNDRLEAIAQSDHTIWNRVTVSADGRIFVNFPPLSSRPLQPMGEIGSDGKGHRFISLVLLH